MRDGIGKRLADSLETALAMSGGWVSILLEHIVEENDESLRNEEEKQLLKQELLSFNQNFACSECNISIEELTPRMFSFNNPYGACPTCAGLGFTMKIDPELLLPKKELSLNGGGLAAWNSTSQGWYFRYVEALAEKYGFSMDVPIKDLSKQALDYILYGSGDDVLTMEYEDSYGHHQVHRGTWEGVVNNFERRYRETTSGFIRSEIERFMSVKPCPDCNGDRLKPESLAVTIADKNIAELSKLTILGAQEFFDKLVLTEREDRIAQQILKEIKERLNFLVNVGLDYLSLSRASGTLSGYPNRFFLNGCALYFG
jgi:excinuclease ABC subunit A